MMAYRQVFSAIFIAICALVLPTTLASLSSTPVTLSTTLGDVVGVRKSAGAGVPMVEVFYGIPFAQPPVGNLRFRSPRPAEPWGSVPLDGTVKPKACWQTIDESFERFPGVEMWNPNTERDEDCLYLNVWRPESQSSSYAGSGDGDGSSRASHKPILVWIFGGGFYSGSATLDVYEASQLAVRNDVIVVNIGYRSGPLGFLYLDRPEVPGNAGLLDQVMALQWVKDNAVNLGGLPDDITIFGESAGAVSVGFHLLSPLSRDLFSRAIMQSSSPTADWGIMGTDKAKARSLDLAGKLNCPSDVDSSSGDDLLACLQNVDPAAISDKQWNIQNMSWFDVTLGPVVDGSFLPDHPMTMLRAGDVKLTNVIAGVNKDEGIYFDLYGFDEIDLNSEELNETQFEAIMMKVAEDNTTLKSRLIDIYSRTETDFNYLNVVDAASGDFLFKCSVVDFAREYTRVGGQVYVYSFEENFSSNPWPDWMGVPHGYEIEVVFGRPLAPGSNNTQAEKNLSELVMEMWTNFARTGSPSAQDGNIHWPLYTSQGKEYVTIDCSGIHTEHRLREETCAIWASRHQTTQQTSGTDALTSAAAVVVNQSDDSNNLPENNVLVVDSWSGSVDSRTDVNTQIGVL